MIVPMKKVLLLTLNQYKDNALIALREAGVVHLESYKSSSEELKALLEQKVLLENAINILNNVEDDLKIKTSKSFHEEKQTFEIVNEILLMEAHMKDLREENNLLLSKIELLSHWGNFSLREVFALREQGIYIQFYKSTKTEFNDLLKRKEIFIKLIKSGKGINYFISIGLKPISLENIEEFQFEEDLEELKSKYNLNLELLNQKEIKLKLFVKYLDTLKKELLKIQEKIEFEQVKSDLQTSQERDFFYITGFVPKTKLKILQEKALKEGWALSFKDPSEDDNVPTYVEYKGLAKLAKPIFSVLETFPGYKEKDISLSFFLFFFVFFGMLVGDAAYGSIFFLLGLGLSFNSLITKSKIDETSLLILTLSISTIIWGAMTGTWFGADFMVNKFPILKTFMVPYLTNENSMKNVMYICFIIGLVQLLTAHIWNFLRQVREKPYIHSFAQIGWLIMLSGLFYLVLNLIIGEEKFPMFDSLFKIIIIGFLIIFIFENQEGDGFLKGILRSLGGLIQLFLNGVAAFADIISYIRLFAVGLAGISISNSFNQMSASLAESDSIFYIIFAIVIVIFGHILNILMSLLSVVVHGIRLNMLEFSNHLNQQWSGFAYNPFKRKNK